MDNIRGLDYLESLPFVDAKAMGAIGHSLGGHNSVFTAVFDERLKVVVSSCGLDSFLDYYGGKEANWEPEKGWCQTRYMLKLAQYKGKLAEIPFDFHELVGALAPRHVLIIAPKEDHNFRAASVDKIVASAKPVFKLYDKADRLRVEHPDGGTTSRPRCEEAYKLFDAVLAGNSKSGPESLPARSRSRDVYFSSWFAEGSRHRRKRLRNLLSGTTTRGVDPDRSTSCASASESGAGTAFPETHRLAFARVTQHHPAAFAAS